jgi:hypothetical protein
MCRNIYWFELVSNGLKGAYPTLSLTAIFRARASRLTALTGAPISERDDIEEIDHRESIPVARTLLRYQVVNSEKIDLAFSSSVGRLAQWESTRFTRVGSLVQTQYRPPAYPLR